MKRVTDHRCFGHFMGAKFIDRDKCRTCEDKEMCEVETALLSHDAPTKPTDDKAKVISKPKKVVDPAWVNEVIDYMIGSYMAILFNKDPAACMELKLLIQKAVTALYEKEEYETTNDWIIAACNRTWELYNTFMTAKLIHLFDNGMPEAPRILVPKKGSGIH